MFARFFGTALLLLISLSGGIAQAADLPADSPLLGAQGAGTSDAKRSPRTDDQTQRVRELIYFFRTYRVFSRDEEWAQTIRELATIGKAAVPELVAELDRTDRDATIRSLAFTLRAIGDARAVPALIRAIPKALRPPGSDCGVQISDPELRAFMLANQNYEDKRGTHVACGRPVNEILPALKRITRHREPANGGDNDPLCHVFLRGTPDEQAKQRAMFEERQKLWQAWWSEHSKDFVTREEMQSVDLPKRVEDVVEKAGLARYGPLFPTGAQVRLGLVKMLRLTQAVYWNGKSHLDFDTGRFFEQYEGIQAKDWGPRPEFGARLSNWYRRNGIDVRYQGPIDGVDLQLWLIDDSRWDTLEAEIQKTEPLQLGREATGFLIRFDKDRTDFKDDELATFLFTTRDGGRGIVQVFPKDQDADRYRLRYRMWLTAPAKPTAKPQMAEPRQAKLPGTPFGKVLTTTLEAPAEGREFLMDLKTGRKAGPPKFLGPAAIADTSTLYDNAQFRKWCREQGIDVFSHATTGGRALAAAPRPKAAAQPFVQLIGLDLIEARILPQTFDELTVEAAREILGRMPDYPNQSKTAWMMIDVNLAEHPDTFAFKTREGTVGLLQMEAAERDAGKLTIRYRLERKD
jgi:hypothetical protein